MAQNAGSGIHGGLSMECDIMNNRDEYGRFRPLQGRDTCIDIWDERDRVSVTLYANKGHESERVLLSLFDDDARELLEDEKRTNWHTFLWELWKSGVRTK